MFRYAALSLLSKTLQTFLSKYLVGIDVENVALPSLVDYEEWGFRISNVKLREGVELITLPGKRRSVKKKRKDKSARETPQKTMSDDAAKTTEPTTKAESETLKEDLMDLNDLEIGRHRDYSDTEAENYSYTDSCSSSRPPTPPASTSCLARTSIFRSAKKDTNRTARKTEEKHEHSEQSQKSTKASEDSYTMVDAPEIDSKETITVPKETSQHDNAARMEPAIADSAQNNEPDKDDDAGEIEIEHALTLRVGEGGRIGVLDVRLKGKDVCVVIEDADLVFEIDSVEREVESSKDAASKPPQSTTQGKPESETAATSSEDKQFFDTSGLARMLNSIPNFVLTNCHIRVVLRTETGKEDLSENRSVPFDAVAEFGLGFFSISGGSDVETQMQKPVDTAEDKGNERDNPDFLDTDFQFIGKRICTGKGNEGGLWVKMHAPSRRRPDQMVGQDKKWALNSWMHATDMCLFRCSGVDVRIRIYAGFDIQQTFGRQKSSWGTEYDEYTMDSMLMGVDYVAPELEEEDSSESDMYDVKAPEEVNVLSFPSIFHRMARGFIPKPCRSKHWPSQDCPHCWRKLDTGCDAPFDLPIDKQMPNPGVLLHLSIEDPVDINVDRDTLEVVEVLLSSLYGGQSNPEEGDSSTVASEVKEELETENKVSKELVGTQDSSTVNTVSTDGPAEKATGKAQHQRYDSHCDPDKFPPFMQPNAVHLVGLEIARINIRVHMTRSDGTRDYGLSFAYWDFGMRCITLDFHQLLAEELQFQDVLLEIGYITLIEKKGTDESTLLHLGHRVHTSSKAPSFSSSWPSTAARLLDVKVPPEVMRYQRREGHALQIHAVKREFAPDFVIRVRIGESMNASADAMNYLITAIFEIKGAMAKMSPKPAEDQEAEPLKEEKTSATHVAVKWEGGDLVFQTWLKMKFPALDINVEVSTENGFNLMGVFEALELELGKLRSTAGKQVLTVKTLASLPEAVRQRIFLFVDDLEPLVEAIGARHASNYIARCRSISKRLAELSKRKKKKKRTKINRKKAILGKLATLDEEELEVLYNQRNSNIRTLAHQASI